MQEELIQLQTRLVQKEIRIEEFLKQKDELQTNIKSLNIYFDIHDSEWYKLGAVLRERLNLKSVGKFENGCAQGRDWDNTEFYIDTQGNKIKKPEQDSALKIETHNPRSKIENGKIYFIKKEGTKLYNEEYDGAWDFKNGRAGVCVNNKWHFIKEDGTKLNDKEYDNVGEFRNGRAIVVMGKKYLYITEDGARLNQEEYDNLEYFTNGIAQVTQNGRKYSIDINGKKIERK